ncbi:SDR family oxidoreductase [Devosia sp. YIM 151766]|uniref:SDR family NAD(P)-dependent oxidoreductase n=1 Tax=Devosia sp. YIM 151766 TaxID=3017325 RepID=UPI00255C6A95|nr:SDR family oxidoreductase [Devosia sp. YIM 151766]WIY53840.1 SDR family oxidoreductase [Devosia sp. YIM 151766]
MAQHSATAALVTGGARGIGRAISEALASAGHDIIVHARGGGPDLKSFLDHLAARYGVKARSVTADFLAPGAVDELFDQLDRIGWPLGVLVNNAGYETNHAAEDMPQDDWNGVLQVNLTAPFQCSQHAARLMKGAGGVIVNITSIHDSIARKGLSHYCAAKAGLRMLGHALALEWAEYGIRVVNIGPGAIETDMNRSAIEAFGRQKFDGWIPAGRVGTVEDVAALVRFVCSKEAGYMTATDLYVDGGYMRNLVRYDDRPGRS